MISLQAKTRNKFGRQTKTLRKKGVLPAVLYGEGIKENITLEVKEKEFERVFKEAGESSLVQLEVNSEQHEVLIHQIARDPLSGKFVHVDFFCPSMKKEIEAEVPLVFEGASPAVGDLGGILVKEIQTAEVKGLAHNLPREIRVNIGKLKTFEDRVLVKDLTVPEGVSILRAPEEIVALVTPPREEIEEEKPVTIEKEAKEREETIQEQKQEAVKENE